MCRHENCRREAYRLVAFANEDELYLHELKDGLNTGHGTFFRLSQGIQLTLLLKAFHKRAEW